MLFKHGSVAGENIISIPCEAQHSPGTRYAIILVICNFEIAIVKLLSEQTNKCAKSLVAGSTHPPITLKNLTITLE